MYQTFSSRALSLVGAVLVATSVSAQVVIDRILDEIEQRIDAGALQPQILVAGETLHQTDDVRRFYVERIFLRAWVGDDGILPVGRALVDEISKADRHGLDPEEYHLSAIRTLIDHDLTVEYAGWLVDLELLLTDAFLQYGNDLIRGRIDPESIGTPELQVVGLDRYMPEMLRFAVSTSRIRETLARFVPRIDAYADLQRARERYVEIVERGGWPQIPGGGTLELNDRGERVSALIERLTVTGDYRTDSTLVGESAYPREDIFDENLKAAVERFQARTGMVPDGMVGTATLRMLNVPAEYRVRQIEINMERWRWMPESLGDWYLMVNIADQRVQVIENGRTVIDMRVIVGLQERRHNTPVFSDSMRYVVINPYWHVPRSIVLREMLPRLRRDPDYLTRNRFEVFSGWGSEGAALDPTTVDWNTVDGESESFSYRFRQKPGPNNALGRLKFMFPNKYRVYLHDTPPGVLFDRNVRTFSHGCIRVERPVDLAEYLLGRNNEPWSRSDIVDAIRDDDRHIVLLDRKLPVHVLYLTAWVDENGLMNFREDPYGRDKRLTDVF